MGTPKETSLITCSGNARIPFSANLATIFTTSLIVENLKAHLQEFLAWHKKVITGDEKGQAQIFLDRLFRAFGHDGVLDVGGQTEFRIRKADNDGGGIAFADLVWKPVVLLEMKKRGADLSRHYRQAFDYWVRLVPNRPRYVVLCNFDEFRIYDFETQMDAPVDTLALSDLPTRWGPLAFLANIKPVFENDRVGVTAKAADALADCFKLLTSAKRKPQVSRADAQRFILQMLVALFAEDIDLLPKYFVTTLINECKTPADTFDLLGGLFAAMNLKPSATGGRYKGVPYFNGGLFTAPARLELQEPEFAQLRIASTFDWSKVQPDIFGTLFQHSMDSEERRAMGAHFTHPADIMKIIGPTIVAPWREYVGSAKTLTELNEVLNRLHHFRVLDPACGSGNFLYIAYRELKRIEASIFDRMETEFKREAKKVGQMRLSFLSAQNFYGIDVLPFAVEIAKVTMMIARKLAIDELHITEPALPLDNLDKNFLVADALLTEDGKRFTWPEADVIIGNPPFVGAKLLKPERGPDYVNALRSAYPEVPGMADYCVYWIRRAHEHLKVTTAGDPVSGRIGLVGTQNIRNNQSRVGGLDHVVQSGTILDAVDNQPWSGEANVSVSIVNWLKSQDEELVPKRKKLWFKIQPSPILKKLKKRGTGTSKDYELDVRECDYINSSLSDQTDVTSATVLSCNTNPQRVFQGITHGHEAFLLSPDEKKSLLKEDPWSEPVIFPYLVGSELVTGDGTPERFLINFEQRDINDAQRYKAAFARVKDEVLPARVAAAEEGKDSQGNMRPHHKQFLERWWKLTWDRADMLATIRRLRGRYVVCSRTTKRPIFNFVSSKIQPGDALQAFMFDDDYSFGILQSGLHWLWFITKCSKQTERPRYTSESVFDTFPWPQSATPRQVQAVAEAGRIVRQVRSTAMAKTTGGLREVYRTLELPGSNPLKDANAVLDDAVLRAYGFSQRKDLLAQLLVLNSEVSKRIEEGARVVSPGIPENYPKPEELISKDCVEPL